LTQSLVHPRELYAPAIELRSAGVIVAHNHPSGTPEPSADDLALTRRLQEAGKLLGIEFIDHVIITADTHYSFRQSGLI
ncbi:MAG TPA: JAB domain-containing protein, partial [bacterium]|nr:JAB domain-containing protein [bacterium]